MRRVVAPAAAALALLLTACASAGTGSQMRGSGDVITRDEIVQASVATAFEAVQRLRPRWLQTRGSAGSSGAPATPVLYMDGVRYGELNRLHEIAAMDVRQIRFINARDATTRYGTGHMGGVILVETVR